MFRTVIRSPNLPLFHERSAKDWVRAHCRRFMIYPKEILHIRLISSERTGHSILGGFTENLRQTTSQRPPVSSLCARGILREAKDHVGSRNAATTTNVKSGF